MSRRAVKFNFVMSGEEKKRLLKLAASENRSAAGWLREEIRRAHSKLPKTAKRRQEAGNA